MLRVGLVFVRLKLKMVSVMLKVCCQLIVRACAGTRASNPSRSFSRACELGVGDWLEIDRGSFEFCERSRTPADVHENDVRFSNEHHHVICC